jgi:presenilin-like A22 family membrane protease
MQIQQTNSWARKYFKVFLGETILFVLSLILAILSSLRIPQIIGPEEFQKILLEPFSFWEILFSFLIVLSGMLLIIRFVRFQMEKNILFKLTFLIPVFFGGIFFLELWIGEPLALIFVVILLFLWSKKPNPLVHNLLMVMGAVGVGTVFGLRLPPLLVVILLVIFSIYDIIAVYKTKHMIKMAKEMLKAKAIPGLILPQKISQLTQPIKELKIGGKFLILGGGDIIFPLLLVTSLVPSSVLDATIVAIFATLGLLVSFWIFALQKIRKPIPALPPIATFSILGYLITTIL